jgi:hypothetical protein
MFFNKNKNLIFPHYSLASIFFFFFVNSPLNILNLNVGFTYSNSVDFANLLYEDVQ